MRNVNLKSRLDVPADDWDRLKRALHLRSSHLQAVLPIEVWEDKDDKRVKAFEYMCRDVTKRYKDRRGHFRKLVKTEEAIKAEPESPANRFRGPPPAEPVSPANEIQEAPLAESKSEVPIAPELMTPRPFSGEMVNQRPVLRYTIDGLATVVFEPESSVQHRDDPFGPFGTHQMHSTAEHSQTSMPLVNNHDYFTHPFGPAAIPMAHNSEFNALGENGYNDFMRRVGPSSSIAINEDDHFGKQILHQHADFAHQYGYGIPPDYSFMGNGYPYPSAREDHDDCFIGNGLESHHIFPMVDFDYSNMPIIGDHSLHLYQLTENNHKYLSADQGITPPELANVQTDTSSIPLNKDHGYLPPQLGARSELSKVEPDSDGPSVDADCGNQFPQVGPQPELSTMEPEDSSGHITPSVEADGPFEIIDKDPFYLGPDDIMSDRDIDGISINDNAGGSQSFEYPDPSDYGL